jgi:hypothetical protein
MGQPLLAVNAHESGCSADFRPQLRTGGALAGQEPASAIDVARPRMHILPANERGEA